MFWTWTRALVGGLQGEEAVHDAIRQQQLAVGATGRILASLRDWGCENEEILWAVLFSLAVLVRDGANPFQPAIRAVAAAGIPPMLTTALDTYKASWRPLLCFLAGPTCTGSTSKRTAWGCRKSQLHDAFARIPGSRSCAP